VEGVENSMVECFVWQPMSADVIAEWSHCREPLLAV